MSAHLPSFSCLLYPTSGHTSTHTHTHWSTAPPTAYCTLCHCPIFQHQCWSMLQKRRRFSFEPLSQLAHHSYCMFATRVRAIESVVLWSCSCHILLWSKNTQTSVTNSPSFIKIILKKKRHFLASHNWKDWLLRWGIASNPGQHSGFTLYATYCAVYACVVLLTYHSVSNVC